MIIKTKEDGILSYLEDSSNFIIGEAQKVYLPETEEEVLEIVREAKSKKIPLTISGAGTGTVGGRIPEDGAVISLERMNRILSIDEKGMRSTLQSGVIIEEFLGALKMQNLFYPPFPTERTACIGGNVATNASGEYSYRFGSTRKYVEKMKVVLSTERILQLERGKYYAEKDGMIHSPHLKIKIPSYRSPEIKSTAGYFSHPGMDLIDLFIGSEGTLGVITEVEVRLTNSLPPRFIIIIFLSKDEKILPLLEEIERDQRLIIFSLEYFDDNSLKFLMKDFPTIPSCDGAIYIEQEYRENSLDVWMELLEEYSVVDSWIGESERDYKRLVEFRHKLPENINEYFREIKESKISIDIAVPQSHFGEFFNFYRRVTRDSPVEYVIFGHIGENHLHLNFFPKNTKEKEQVNRIYTEAVTRAVQARGTVSAEHGIGKLKHKYLEMMYGKRGIMEMVRVKKEIDPFCIFGLNNIFPKELLNQ